MTKGVVYVVWGDQIRPLLERSITSVKKWHPECKIVVLEGDSNLGLMNKPKMLLDLVTSTRDVDEWLYLDADTVVLGSLEQGFKRLDKGGICCCINECPWLRRYNTDSTDYGDITEYNSGVLFLTNSKVYSYNQSTNGFLWAWNNEIKRSSPSKWLCGDQIQQMDGDDQLAFSYAIQAYNPYVLPLNYNFRPGFHTRFFTPLKVWHSIHDVPKGLEEFSLKHDGANAPIQWCTLRNSTTEDHKFTPTPKDSV